MPCSHLDDITPHGVCLHNLCVFGVSIVQGAMSYCCLTSTSVASTSTLFSESLQSVCAGIVSLHDVPAMSIMQAVLSSLADVMLWLCLTKRCLSKACCHAVRGTPHCVRPALQSGATSCSVRATSGCVSAQSQPASIPITVCDANPSS